MFSLIYRNNNECGDQTLTKCLIENSVESKHEYSVISIARLSSFQKITFLECSFYGIFSNCKIFTVKSETQPGLSGLHSLLLGKHMVYFSKSINVTP